MKTFKMKMDSKRISGGLPHSPMKPPLPPKPKNLPKSPSRRLGSINKIKTEKSQFVTEKHEIDEKSFSETLFLSRNLKTSYSMSAVDQTSLQNQSEEEFFSFNSSLNISLDSSPVSLLSCGSFRDGFGLNENSSNISLNDSDPQFLGHSPGNSTPDQEFCPPNPSLVTNDCYVNDQSNINESSDCLNAQCTDLTDRCDSFSLFFDTVNVSSSNTTLNCDNSSTSEAVEGKLNDENVYKENKVFLIAKEFTTTEQEYVDALKLLVINFKAFIDKYNTEHHAIVIPQTDLDKIFNTLPQLLHLNEDLLNDLTNRIDNWGQRKRIADVIVRKGPFLKLYATYMKDFESQCNYIDECCQKYPKFAKALTEFEMSPICKKLSLKHYMLKPVQRIPHYRLLLENYLKHLDTESVEYHDAETALSIVKDVLHHANSHLKLAENFWKLLQIQTNLGNYEIIKPGRLFVKEGELKKLSRKDIQLRFIILLSDCLLYTISSSSYIGWKVKYKLPLSAMKVFTQPGYGTDFSIITSTRSFTLRAKNDRECNDWVQVLRRTINENISRQLSFANNISNSLNSSNFESLKLGREAPVWVQDKSTTMCQVCTAEFTVTFRRHHCRCCGKVVCADCSSNKAPLQYMKFQSARVCEDCYRYLLQEFHDPEAKMHEIIKHDLKLEAHEVEAFIESIKNSFKKMDSVKKAKKYIPQRLKEVSASDYGSSMSGWLYFRKNKREWKRLWFVLKDQVLYMYKASQDVVAYDSLPVLGYVVDRIDDEEDMDSSLIFRLTHAGQMPVVFSAPTKQSADLWVAALTEATVLK